MHKKKETGDIHVKIKNIYTYCGVCVKSSHMHPDEVEDTPKEFKDFVKMDIVPDKNTF